MTAKKAINDTAAQQAARAAAEQQTAQENMKRKESQAREGRGGYFAIHQAIQQAAPLAADIASQRASRDSLLSSGRMSLGGA
jgi:hypothetical protein